MLRTFWGPQEPGKGGEREDRGQYALVRTRDEREASCSQQRQGWAEPGPARRELSPARGARELPLRRDRGHVPERHAARLRDGGGDVLRARRDPQPRDRGDDVRGRVLRLPRRAADRLAAPRPSRGDRVRAGRGPTDGPAHGHVRREPARLRPRSDAVPHRRRRVRQPPAVQGHPGAGEGRAVRDDRRLWDRHILAVRAHVHRLPRRRAARLVGADADDARAEHSRRGREPGGGGRSWRQRRPHALPGAADRRRADGRRRRVLHARRARQLHAQHHRRARLGLHRACHLRPLADRAGRARRALVRVRLRAAAAPANPALVQRRAVRAAARAAVRGRDPGPSALGPQRRLPGGVPEALPTRVKGER